MKKKLLNYIFLEISALLAIVFIVFTILVTKVDVQAIGPNDTVVGFATLNGFYNYEIGYHDTLYKVTQYGGYLVFLVVGTFGLIGLIQWITRKSLLKVDYNILALGIFFVIVFTLYFTFDAIAINYRPVLIDGKLEPSYPSSTILRTLSILPLIDQLVIYIKNKKARLIGTITTLVVVACLFFGRILSGCHWITDIIGGTILMLCLLSLYLGLKKLFKEKLGAK